VQVNGFFKRVDYFSAFLLAGIFFAVPVLLWLLLRWKARITAF